MFSSKSVTSKKIRGVFADEVATMGGEIIDIFHENDRLYMRSVLPRIEDVRQGDGVKGGIALKAMDDQVWVHPYLFRLVCSNGAIRAETIQTHHLRELGTLDPKLAIWTIREAIRACAQPEAFLRGVNQMRSAAEQNADFELTCLRLLTGLKSPNARRLFETIMQRFLASEDQSQFGLMNAVTSVARDTPDPEQRWDLEELGGAVPAFTQPKGSSPLVKRLRQTAQARRATENVTVGAA